MTWIIKKANRIPTHCGVAYESVCSLARGHVIRVWDNGVHFGNPPLAVLRIFFLKCPIKKYIFQTIVSSCTKKYFLIGNRLKRRKMYMPKLKFSDTCKLLLVSSRQISPNHKMIQLYKCCSLNLFIHLPSQK